jgi:hypothetical protein
MSDFVPEDGGDFRLVFGGSQEASGDVDESAGGRKSIDLIIIEDCECIGNVSPIAVHGYPLANLVDVTGDAGVVENLEFLPDVLIDAGTDFHFLSGRDQDHALFAAGAGGCASRRQQDRD